MFLSELGKARRLTGFGGHANGILGSGQHRFLSTHVIGAPAQIFKRNHFGHFEDAHFPTLYPIFRGISLERGRTAVGLEHTLGLF
jgi:hypothetical protein